MIKDGQVDLCGAVDFARDESMPDLTQDQLFSFACKGCGDCCRGREDIVLSGYDLYRIAKRHGITVAELQKINQLDSAGFRPGVNILVPPKKAAVKNSRPKSQIASAGKAGKQKGRTVRVADAQTHCVKPGDTIWSISKQYNLSPKEVLAVNGMTVSTAHLRPGDVVRLN